MKKKKKQDPEMKKKLKKAVERAKKDDVKLVRVRIESK